MSVATIEFRCKSCGSTSVQVDATAVWCLEKQQFELAGVMDNMSCQACGFESKNGFEPNFVHHRYVQEQQ